MKYFLILTINLILMPLSQADSQEKDCGSNPIYCQIIKNSPKIDQGYALDLARYINEAAVEFNIKPYRLAAILAQESGYKLSSVNKKSKDYGIAQINHRTVAAFGLCKNKLLTDLNYSIKAGAMILADFKKRYGHKEENYWTRYNSSNPEKREEYKQLVSRYL